MHRVWGRTERDQLCERLARLAQNQDERLTGECLCELLRYKAASEVGLHKELIVTLNREEPERMVGNWLSRRKVRTIPQGCVFLVDARLEAFGDVERKGDGVDVQ
jgi:triphosphoribosyl-dephospho-CoA synthetase